MVKTKLGVIEGFYGKPYAQNDCLDLCKFLSDNKFDFYIYAPKNASFLRNKWQERLKKEDLDEQVILSSTLNDLNLHYGFGISPLNICKDYKNLLPKLIEKCVSLAKKTHPTFIALLFDDIKIEENEGMIQNIIIKDLYEKLLPFVKNIIVCPTFYSQDPILEKVFGKMPKNYFLNLKDGLNKDISFFYTGPKVLSKDITKDDLKEFQQHLGSNISIWDNYPVNDGQKICDKIYTKPFNGRSSLNNECFLHAINPMLECSLSKISICTLKDIYLGKSDKEIQEHQNSVLNKLFLGKAELVKPFFEILQNEGKSALTENKKAELLKILKAIDSKASLEMQLYLQDFYKFDKACLTS